ncbi:MAG: lysine--tRNA ligase, partial [Candidatus Competibacteraceae bacterium]|nr:lysine--tRNA ligase [Candidatus Competibacteraceae bacterium]
DITAAQLSDLTQARALAEQLGIKPNAGAGLGQVQTDIFEHTVEHRLLNPTFITQYPTEVSPLSRRNDDNPDVT